MKLRIRRRAKKELLDFDDDAIFFALVKGKILWDNCARLYKLSASA